MTIQRRTTAFTFVSATLLMSCVEATPPTLYHAPQIPNVIDGVVFEAGNWEPHLPAGDEGSSWGNHRAVVEIEDTDADAILVTIPWRRHDREPAARSIIVVDSARVW